MLEFYHKWSPDASALTPRGHMKVPLHPQLHSSEMPAGNITSTVQDPGVAGTDSLHRSASDLITRTTLSVSQACTSMGNQGISSLPRHNELFSFETYNCSFLNRKIILSQPVSLLISTYKLLTRVRNLFFHSTI